MEQKKAVGFGFRGWFLLIVLFIGFMTFQVFTNFPLNILSDFYGGSQKISLFYTAGTAVGIVLQLILSAFMPKIKSVKKLAAIFGAIAVVAAIGVAAIPFFLSTAWYIAYFVINVTVTIYVLFSLSILAGQWFPRRKGTVMGIATIAFPFTNGVIGFFAEGVFGRIGAAAAQNGGEAPVDAILESILKGFMPFIIAAVVGYLLFVFLIKDYPEQCGAYRDNDKNFTPEMAQAMMIQEIEDRKTTVWTSGHALKNRDFWCASVTCGLLLCGAVGTMTQSNAIIAAFPELTYTTVMMMVAIFGAIGSWLLGVIDTAVGTKKSMIIATILMILSGILGLIAVKTGIGVFTIISLILVAIFMGASSNYTVSVAAQYWRREDFPSVFACLNPISNIFNAAAPVIIVALISSALYISGVFGFLLITGIIGTVLMIIFSAKHVKAVDDKYREAAGKELNDELEGRK